MLKLMAMRFAALQALLLFVTILTKTDALFVQPPSKLKSYPDLELAAADRLGIPYKGLARDAGKAASLPNFALSLNANFDRLDKATFDKLRGAYGGWSETKSRVTWKQGRRYTLLDFLPPILQACSGLYFRSSRTPQRGLPSIVGGPNDRVKKYTQQEVLLTSNCWGFAWEVLYQADNKDTRAITISTADPTSAWRAFTGPGFDLIQSSRTKPKILTDKQVRNKKIQGGDVLLIWHQNPSTASGTELYLDHVATVLDDDVYYEKSGSGDRVPFRISTWQMITANFPTRIFFWEWRRLVRNNPLSPSLYGSEQTRLQPARKVFGVDSQIMAATGPTVLDRGSVLKQLRPSLAQSLSLQTDTGDSGVVESQTYTGILALEDLVFDPETGRASLPKSAFQPEWYSEVLMMLSKNPYMS